MNAKFHDKLNMFRKMSFAKAWNYYKLKRSFKSSKKKKIALVKGRPFSISIEPTTACNLGCPECPSGLKQFTRKTGNLKQSLNKKIIDDLSKELFYLTFYFQGEPYINPNFLDFVSYANTKKIYTATSTNAHFLTPENAEKTVKSGLDRLIISIDGSTQAVYEQYRKEGSLEKVIEGTKNIIEAKRKLKSNTPYVIFQFLVVKPNEHQIDEVKILSEELGVDELKLKSAQVYNYKNGNPLIPENEKYSRYKKQKDGSYILKNAMDDECWRMWQGSVITWDGKVVPCCFDKDAKHQFGDLSKENFDDIWHNKQYQSFRNQLLKNRESIGICKNCSEGTKVWV